MPDQTPEPLTDDAGVLAPCCQYSHTRMTCETDCGNCNVCRFTARVAELEAQLDESRRDVGAARGTAGALQARVVELRAQVDARDARIAELERDVEWARTAEATTLDVANRNIAAYASVRADLDTARRWAGWFAAERDEVKDYLNQAAEFLQEAADEREAAYARVAELEASQPFPAGYVTGFLNDQDRVTGLEHVAYSTRVQAVERAEYRRPSIPTVAVYALRKVSE